MKKHLFILCLMLNISFLTIQAQNMSSLVIKSIVENNDEIDLKDWTSKIKSIIENNGMTESWQTQFVLTSNVSVGEKQTMESGIQKMVVYKFIINLEVRNWINNSSVHTESFDFSGSGQSLKESFRQCISKIKGKNAQFEQFFTKTKKKITEYYQKECDNLLTKAKKEIELKNYEKALTIFYSIPENVKCYKEIQSKQQEVYLLYQNKECAKKILEAKVLYASQKYEDALYILKNIDDDSNCKKDRNKIIEEITQKYEVKQIDNSKKEPQKQEIINNIYQQQILIIQK